MHENFCVANIILCKICDQGILKSEYEEHISEHEEEKKKEEEIIIDDTIKDLGSIKYILN
jgi:hypothetical protein